MQHTTFRRHLVRLIVLGLSTSLVLGFSACKKKKDNPFLLLFGLSGAILDPNGVPSPADQGTATQEAPTSGDALLDGTIQVYDGDTLLTPGDFDYGRLEIILWSPAGDGQELQKTSASSDGSYRFEQDDLANNNYRALLVSGNGINYAYVDFNFVFDPTQSGPTRKLLPVIKAQRMHHSSGPANISGRIVTGGFSGGGVSIPAGPLPAGTTVELRDESGNLIASTTSDANGNYSFNVANLANANYVIAVKGAEQSLQGRPFTDVSVMFRFQFEGAFNDVPTAVSLSPISSAWQSATEAQALVTGRLVNIATPVSFSGTQVAVKNNAGNTLATVSVDANGSFSLSPNLSNGSYTIEVIGNNLTPAGTAFAFTAHPAGQQTSVSVGDVQVLPKDSAVSVSIQDASTGSPLTSATIRFRPAADYPVSYLSYLSGDSQLGSLVSQWISEKNSSGSYQTWAPLSASVDGSNLLASSRPGKWEYEASAPGYGSGTPVSLVLNGVAVSFAQSLQSDPRRSRIGGSITVLDEPNGGLRHAYPSASGYASQGRSLSGLCVVLLGNTNNDGRAVAHVTTTAADGSYAFTDEHIVFYSNLASDQAKAELACDALANASTITSGISGNDPVSNSVYTDSGNYYFKSGSGSVWVIDPRGHLQPYSTVADNTSVASNQPTPNNILNQSLTIQHKARVTIRGTVSNAISTASLSGAQVELGRDTNPDPAIVNFVAARQDSVPISNQSRQSASSDIVVPTANTASNGAFSFTNLDPGSYILQVSLNGYVTTQIPVVVTDAGDAVINVSLVPDGARGNITGFIKLPGGFDFLDAYTLEITHPTSGNHPVSGVSPASLSSGPSQFENAPQYTVHGLTPGEWKVRFVSAGYKTVEGLVMVYPNQTTNFDIITMVPGSHPAAAVGGKTLNAINNQAVSGVTIRLRPGMNIKTGPYAINGSGQEIAAVTSGSDGTWSIAGVPAGNYTLEASANGYATTYRTVISAGVDTPNPQSVLISPVLGADEVRIVLSWNEFPHDLDSHLEYGSAVPKQVVYNDRNKLGGDLVLDWDVITGYGPETVTLKGSVWNQPRRAYSVFNYSATYWSTSSPHYSTLNIGQSGANIRIFKSQGLVKTYSAGPAQVNHWWDAFCLGTNRTIIEIGQAGCLASSYFHAPWN